MRILATLTIFFNIIPSLSGIAQTILYKEGHEMGIYCPDNNNKEILIEKTDKNLDSYNIKNDSLYIYSDLDTMSFSLKANWHLSVSLNNIEGYPVGSSNVFKISETTFLKESGLNLVLCENEKIVWKIIGNKGGKIPDCSETGIDGINTNSNFNPLFSSDRRYMAFESVGAGFLGSNRIFIIDLKDGTEKKYNGFDITWSNAGNYLLYKSDRSGKYLILCVKNGKRINVKFETAVWLTL